VASGVKLVLADSGMHVMDSEPEMCWQMIVRRVEELEGLEVYVGLSLVADVVRMSGETVYSIVPTEKVRSGVYRKSVSVDIM